MATPYHHAVSSAKRHGGCPQDYQDIHDWFDASKAALGDFRHRALRHHTFGIFEAERVFGTLRAVDVGDGVTKQVPVRLVAEQHVVEDCGYLPTVQDWLASLKPEPWMNQPRKLSREDHPVEQGLVEGAGVTSRDPMDVVDGAALRRLNHQPTDPIDHEAATVACFITAAYRIRSTAGAATWTGQRTPTEAIATLVATAIRKFTGLSAHKETP